MDNDVTGRDQLLGVEKARIEAVEAQTRRNMRYGRSPAGSGGSIRDKKLAAMLEQSTTDYQEAALGAARAQVLNPSDEGYLQPAPGSHTWKATQHQIKQAVDISSAAKAFNLHLDNFGPYRSRYTRNGRWLLLGGAKGHLSVLDWQRKRALAEWHVRDAVHDCCFLHNQTWCAVAQHKYVFIYDSQGTELHCLRNHARARQLTFLPYHWLLVSSGESSWLKWQDVSTGQPVAEKNTRLGPTKSLAQNPWNAIVVAGHGRGKLTLWAPNLSKPVATVLAHRGPVSGVCVDRGGRHLVSAGLDGQVHVWDVRMYRRLHSYYSKTPTSQLDISDRGVLALAQGSSVQLWKNALQAKQKAPYMNHRTATNAGIFSVRFVPYEDVLGLGTSDGFSSILVPGSGEPNFDSLEANPYETRDQRREAEVHALLDKLQPDTITVDPTVIGGVKRPDEDGGAASGGAGGEKKKFVAKHKAKGKSKIANVQARKRKVHWEEIVRDKKAQVVRRIEEERQAKKQEEQQETDESNWSALSRFKKKAGY